MKETEGSSDTSRGRSIERVERKDQKDRSRSRSIDFATRQGLGPLDDSIRDSQLYAHIHPVAERLGSPLGDQIPPISIRSREASSRVVDPDLQSGIMGYSDFDVAAQENIGNPQSGYPQLTFSPEVNARTIDPQLFALSHPDASTSQTDVSSSRIPGTGAGMPKQRWPISWLVLERAKALEDPNVLESEESELGRHNRAYMTLSDEEKAQFGVEYEQIEREISARHQGRVPSSSETAMQGIETTNKGKERARVSENITLSASDSGLTHEEIAVFIERWFAFRMNPANKARIFSDPISDPIKERIQKHPFTKEETKKARKYIKGLMKAENNNNNKVYNSMAQILKRDLSSVTTKRKDRRKKLENE